jgi:hypothetical protein
MEAQGKPSLYAAVQPMQPTSQASVADGSGKVDTSGKISNSRKIQ